MTDIFKLGPEHEGPLADFFAAISVLEVRDDFHPHEFTPEEARRRCSTSGRDEYYVAIENGKVAAYGMLRGWDEGHEIPSLGLCVRPGFQGRGLGTEMAWLLLSEARRRGAPRLILKVRRGNARAIALYRKLRFRLEDLDTEYLRGEVDLAASFPDLTIILTTIDEAENLAFLVPELKVVFGMEGVSLDILVVDGGSWDGTRETAERLGCRVMLQTGPGYAQAIRDGIVGARGDYVLVMDPDGSHEPRYALELWQNRHRADVVINSRYVKDGGRETEPWRDLLSRVLNWLYRVGLGLPYREISGGFRIYHREKLQGLRLEARYYEIQEELLIRSHWAGHTAVEIPYTYRARAHGASKARVLKYGWHLLQALQRFRCERRRRG